VLSFSTLLSHHHAGITLRHLCRRRAFLSKYMTGLVPSLTTAHHLRLVSMVVIQMLGGLVVCIADLYFNISGGINPWISWQDTHFDFSDVLQFPTVLLPLSQKIQIELLWWPAPMSGIVFFLCFAFMEDARKEYRPFFSFLRRVIFRKPIEKPSRPPMSSR
jgi:pheromone a factor receptor